MLFAALHCVVAVSAGTVQLSFRLITGTASSGSQSALTFTSVTTGLSHTSALSYSPQGAYVVSSIVQGVQSTQLNSTLLPVTLLPPSSVYGSSASAVNDNSLTLTLSSSIATVDGHGLGLTSNYSTFDLYSSISVRCFAGLCGSYAQLTVQLHNTSNASLAQPIACQPTPIASTLQLSCSCPVAIPSRCPLSSRGYVDGCFDVMHSGHYNLIRQARLLCDELVVGVHSAAEIEKTKAAAPVQTDAERMRLVGGVKWVDEVVLSTAYSPDYLAQLKQYGCDFCIHGSDVNLNAEGKDPFAEVKRLGMFRSIERVDSVSTTDIINRLLRATHEDRNVQQRTEAEEDADSYLLTTDRLCQFMNTTRHRPHKPHPGQRVVYVSGSWDLFHSGHVRLLQECKKLGDFLLVGIHEDTTVERHCGPAFPIMYHHTATHNAKAIPLTPLTLPLPPSLLCAVAAVVLGICSSVR